MISLAGCTDSAMDQSKAKANYSRVCQLLVDKGGDALRAELHAIHPPLTLSAVLNANKSVLQEINVINPSQWNVLFPKSGVPDSNKFDISLLSILLRNICGLSSPPTGWNKMPPAEDTSKSADIVRIKLFRNEVCGHTARAQLDDEMFEKLWQEISKPLIRSGIPPHEVDEIKVAPLNPRKESYIEKLKEREPTSCLPDKLPMFTGRKVEIQNVIALLKDEEKAVVSLHGGPGFGKTAIAVEVSHQLSKEHNFPIVFSQLTTATTVDEMALRLCRDVGVNHEDDPKSSLILWLKNRKKIILIMDGIDNLLDDKANFYEFIRLLRKNSNQYCQIVTTSRMFFEIRDLLTDKVQVNEMDNETCMELLKKQCSKQDENILRKLAELCGNIPLAMCIAGSLVDDFEDPDELLKYLEKQPMKTLECPESDQYVNRAINVSYEKCSDEEQEIFVRLSVFEGSFSEDAAKVVIEKDNLDTSRILKKLVSRSLVKQPTKHRYSIHLLIKYFLKDKQRSAEEVSERALGAAMRAEVLMVEYFLKLGHQLTMESYSKDGYKSNRETLKQEASNIKNVLKICCQQEDPAGRRISDWLARSSIYTTSAKFFSLFARTIIPGPIVDEFLERCAMLADTRKQHAIKINFDCVLAYQERSKAIGKSDEDFICKMKQIKEEFETHQKVLLEENKSLCVHYYSQYGEYLLRQAQKQNLKEKLQLQIQARDQLQKSLELSETLTSTSEGKADKIFSLLHLGNTCKLISGTERSLNKNNQVAIDMPLKQAQRYYEEAVHMSKSHLGEHELTSSCYKSLGDLLLSEPEMAEEKYTIAKQMRENLGLEASERHILLLNNLGKCLRETHRVSEAIEILESACDTAEKLGGSDEPTVCKTKVYTSLAIAYHLVNNYPAAVRYAKKAMEFDQIRKILQRYEQETLKNIVKWNDI